jgi:hypothetical protein
MEVFELTAYLLIRHDQLFELLFELEHAPDRLDVVRGVEDDITDSQNRVRWYRPNQDESDNNQETVYTFH